MQGSETETPRRPRWLVVAINLAIMVAYTVYFRYVDHSQYNIIAVAFLMAIQVVLCLILAIFVFRKEFLLSSILVLLIGFSTCWAVYSL